MGSPLPSQSKNPGEVNPRFSKGWLPFAPPAPADAATCGAPDL